MKKKLTMCLSVALIAVMVICGTLAYLTSEDGDVNVMALGNVKIEQHEYQRVEENGEFKKDTIDNQTSYVLEDFEQYKPLLPIVGDPNEPGNSPAYAGWDDTTVRMSQVGSYGGMQVFAGKNAVDKFVTVENTGKTDAYVRTLVAIEIGSTDGSLIGKSDRGVDVDKASNSTAPWIRDNIGTVTVDGNNYMLIEYVYRGASDVERHVDGILPAGDTTYPNLSQVYLKSEATNEDCESIDGNNNGMLDILVFSQAVQAEGFDDAETALDTAFGPTTTTNHPWIDAKFVDEIGVTGGTYDLTNDIYTIDTGYFHTQNATADVTINGNGNTVYGTATSIDAFQWEGGTIPAMSPIFSSANGSKVTVNDVTFTGTMSAVMAGHYQNATYNNYDTEFNNVNIVDAEVVLFSAGVSPALAAYGKLVMNNCNVYGTTLSPLDTDPMWPVYDMAVVNYSDTTLNNSKVGSISVWNQAKLTVADGSEVDEIVVRGNMNTTKYGITIEDGATVGTIDLSNITDKARVNITIETGAVVEKIVANSVEYDSIADWQNS